MREGAYRRRAVEPQLGLVPQDGARSARVAADHREPAAVAGHERVGRGRDRFSPGRHHVSGREPGRARAARRLARPCPPISARHPHDQPRRSGGADAWIDRELDRRALHRERRQGRAAEGGSGDRRGGAAARRGDRDPVRRTRHRDARRARLGGGDRKGPHRVRQGRARRRRMVPAVLRQSRHRAAAAQSAGHGHAHPAARRRPGNLGLGRPFRLSQADGRRLHRRDPRGADDRPRTR